MISTSKAVKAVSVCAALVAISVLYSSTTTKSYAISPSRILRGNEEGYLTSRKNDDDDESSYDENDALMRIWPDSVMMKDAQKWKNEEAKGDSVVAWLLSFPNSGTTYTQQVFQAIANGTTAGNYGRGCTISSKTKAIVPLHKDEPNGPYLNWIKLNIPKPYVLTKTHCGGFCFECLPEQYIETDRSFLTKCASGLHISKDDEGNHIEKFVKYSPAKVRRIIHLIRDPFDNVVARMRFLHHEKQEERIWRETYPKTRQGFRDYCEQIFDPKYQYGNRFIDKAIVDMAQKIPCGMDFFRYIQWHNRAFETTHALKANDVPTLLMNYEQYESDYDSAVAGIQEFLKIPKLEKVKMPKFYKGHSYHDYFTKEEIKVATALMREVASPITWKYIRQYMKPALQGASTSTK